MQENKTQGQELEKQQKKKPKISDRKLKMETLITFLCTLPALGLNIYIFQFAGGILTAPQSLWLADIGLTIFAMVLWGRLYVLAG